MNESKTTLSDCKSSSKCIQKQHELAKIFINARTNFEKQSTIIQLGKKLSKMDCNHKIEQNRVVGCQNNTYIAGYMMDYNSCMFCGESDSLISAGLLYMLIEIYKETSPSEILTCSFVFPKLSGIESLISINRTNGMYQMHIHMKKIALLWETKTK